VCKELWRREARLFRSAAKLWWKQKKFPYRLRQTLKEGRLCWKSRAGKLKVSSSGPGVDQNIAFHALPNCHDLILSISDYSVHSAEFSDAEVWTQSWERFPLQKPRVGQNIVMHASLTARNFFLQASSLRFFFRPSWSIQTGKFLASSFCLQVLFLTILVHSTSLFCTKPAPYILTA